MKNSETYIDDAISAKFRDYYSKNSYLVNEIRQNVKIGFYSSFKELAGDRLWEGQEACDLISTFLESSFVKRELVFLTNNNLYPLFALSRRMNTAYLLEQFNDPVSAQLSRFFQNQYLIKYSKTKNENDFVYAENLEYKTSDFNAIYRIEVIGEIIQKLMVLKRTSAKGGGFQFKGKGIEPYHSMELRKALTVFDQKMDKESGSLYGWMGLLKKNESLSGINKNIFRDLYIVGCMANISKRTFAFSNINFPFPNHIATVIGADKLLLQLDGLDKSFHALYGMDFHTWLKCLSKISMVAFHGSKRDIVNVLYRAGYFVLTKEELYGAFKDTPDILTSDIDNFLKIATLSTTSKQGIRLGSITSNFVLIEIAKDYYLFDCYQCMPYFFYSLNETYRNLTHMKVEQVKTKGLIFEEQVAQQAAKFQKKLKFTMRKSGIEIKIKDGSTIAEIDVPIEHGTLLILLDCKSLLLDERFHEGDYRVTSNRNQKILELVSYRDSQASKIASKSNEIVNFPNIPRYVCSHVISPVTEFIFPQESYLWWKESMPRVSTLETFFKEIYPALIRMSPKDTKFIFETL